MKDDYEKRIG
jgi:chromosome segregation ATPase